MGSLADQKNQLYYDKPTTSFANTSICSMSTSRLRQKVSTTKRSAAPFGICRRRQPDAPPKAHLNASVIDIASFPKVQRQKMHWLMGRLNIGELANDEVYALDFFG